MNPKNFNEEIETRLESEIWDKTIVTSVLYKRQKQQNQKILIAASFSLLAIILLSNYEPVQNFIANLFFDDSQLFSFEPLTEIAYFLSQ